METVEKRSQSEVFELKQQWKADPSWDIEDTEGFEAHHDELLAFRMECEAEWEQQDKTRLEKRAVSLGCPGNLDLARYVENLESRIKRITDRLEQIGV